MAMRVNDDPDVGKVYRGRRVGRTIFGFVLALAGLAAFFLLPTRDTRTDVGIACAVLLGGMYIDPAVMKEAVKTFTPFIPWKRD